MTKPITDFRVPVVKRAIKVARSQQLAVDSFDVRPDGTIHIQVSDTLHSRAVAEQSMVGGRFAAVTKTKVIGSGPVEYPQLPANSPWHHDPVRPRNRWASISVLRQSLESPTKS